MSIINVSIVYGTINDPQAPSKISLFFLLTSLVHVIAFIIAIMSKSPSYLISLITNIQSFEVLIQTSFYLLNLRLKLDHRIADIERELLIDSLTKLTLLGLNYYCYLQYVLRISMSRYIFVSSFVLAYKFFCIFDQFKKLRVSMKTIRSYTRVLTKVELVNEEHEHSTCAICLDSHDDTSRILRCHHLFHLNCLAALVNSKRNSFDSILRLNQQHHCPICKGIWNTRSRKKSSPKHYQEESKNEYKNDDD